MSEICVIYLSEDEPIVERLVALLRTHWEVWWAHDIAHGDWEEAVRSEIPKALAIVTVLSQHTKGARSKVLKDELRFAAEQHRPIFPFVIGTGDIPFGFGDLNRTEAQGWCGDSSDMRYKELTAKIAVTIGPGRSGAAQVRRMRELTIREKTLQLPAFVFSLSSFESQITPEDGATLLALLDPSAALVSAYDAWQHKTGRQRAIFRSRVEKLCKPETVVFLDSGNYEAYRKRDLRRTKTNPNGWHKRLFLEAATSLSPDVVFSFDTINPKGDPDRVIARIVDNFRADDRALRERDFLLCPIIHLPSKSAGDTDCAAHVVSGVARELEPLMLALPERELGDGLRQRARTVLAIRKALNARGRYYPLHLLGTGNPISMAVLSVAGADAFDGLEWCRTVADYQNGNLFHFQHWECFGQTNQNRIRDPRVRSILGNPDAPYTIKALSYNVDFFNDWMDTVQSMIHAGQAAKLLKSVVPNIGPEVAGELCS